MEIKVTNGKHFICMDVQLDGFVVDIRNIR